MSANRPFENSQTYCDLLQQRAAAHGDRPVYTFLRDGELDDLTYTYAQLDQRARQIAGWLAGRSQPGDRVMLVFSQGLEYLASYFGCLYAGVIAVPAYPPRRNRRASRILSMVADADIRIALTTSPLLEQMQKTIQAEAPLASLAWQPVEAIAAGCANDYRRPDINRNDIAFLQYTSGSTGTPKGVMVTHANLMANQQLIHASFQQQPDSMVLAGWLPLHHDMGLIGNALHPVYMGGRLVFMSPVDFLQKPVRWLRMIQRFGGTLSGAPNFAYRLCAEEVGLEECEGLDLSSWQVAFNGAEPVRPATMHAFAEKFAPFGFQPNACSPCYGMAETTLLVTGSVNGSPMVRQQFDADALENGQAKPTQAATASDTATAGQTIGIADTNTPADLAGCGAPFETVDVRIVDPETHTECAAGAVGEILVKGETVAAGYWQREEESRETFNTTFTPLVKNGKPPASAYLRTGDLGFMHQGQLYVTGRLKDLIIVRGANHYPHDIERTVETSHPALMPGAGAAFQIASDDAGGGFSAGSVVVVQEVRRAQMRQINAEEVIQDIRTAVSVEHEIRLAAIVLLRPASTPKTTSGKIQRSEARRLFLADSFKTVGSWSENGAAATPQLKVYHEAPPETATTTKPDANASADNAMAASATFRPQLSPAQQRQVNDLSRWLTVRIAQRLKMPQHEIDHHTPLAAYGMDSVAATRLSGELSTHLGKPVPATLAYDYPTIALLATYLITGQAPQPAALVQQQHLQDKDARRSQPLAVVGIGCRFPGAPSPAAFWQMLQTGRSAISAPPARCSSRGHAVAGGYLQQVEEFDARFFRINPREADHIDPQHRLLLEVVWECFENAGIAVDALAGSRTGVFAGAGSNDYMRLQTAAGLMAGGYTATGNSLAMVANRISYAFDFRGPSLTIDTACSSSLAAIHQAAASLRNSECDLAVASGVNLILSPDATTSFTEAGMLAEDGVCRAFDAGASGFVRGEGCGAVLLQPLSQAVQQGNRIYAVLRGSAVNQDGRSNGLTAPNRLAQQAVIRTAISDANVSPAEISYVEAHGTGTELGDPIEMGALQTVLTPAGLKRSTLRVGSVKTGIGHLEAAAGIAGFIKVCLSLHHQQIPPTLNFKTPSPHIDWSLPIEVPTACINWPRGKQPRIAGVSSFGFGGANVHAILEEAPQPAAQQLPPASDGHLLLLSARTGDALKTLAGSTASHIQRGTSLAELCSTMAGGRSHFKHRLAVPCDDNLSLRDTLQQYAQQGETTGVSLGTATAAPGVVFMFSGQGGQHASAGKQLYASHAPFRAQLDAAAAIMQRYWPRPLLEIIWDAQQWQAVDIQPALVCLQYAMAMTWIEAGVQPTAITGHSLGEFAAAAVAGVFPLEEAIRIVAKRAALVGALQAEGGMLAVFAAAGQIRDLAPSLGGEIDIAAVNGPRQTVIGGCKRQLQELATTLKAHKITTRMLQTTHGFHSPLVEPVLDEFEATVASVQLSAPTLNYISAQTGLPVSEELATPGYWRNNLRKPVNFYAALQHIATLEPAICIETGAGSTLASLTRAARLQLDTAPGLSGDDNERKQWFATAARLYAAGAKFDAASLLGYKTQPAVLPGYPFQRSRHWFDETGAAACSTAATNAAQPINATPAAADAGDSSSKLPGERLDLGVSQTVFATTVDANSYLAGHCVGNTIFFPAAGYLAIASAAASAMGHPSAAVSLEIDQPLKLGAGATARVQTIVSDDDGALRYRIVSKQQNGWIEHARGAISASPGTSTGTPAAEEIATGNPATQHQTHDLAEHYQRCAAAGLNYSGAFLGLLELTAAGNTARSRSALPQGFDASGYALHPALLDACLQTLAAVADTGQTRTFLPASFAQFTMHRSVQPGEVLQTTATLHQPDGDDQICASLRITGAGGAAVATIHKMVLKPVAALNLEGAMFCETWPPQIRHREAVATTNSAQGSSSIQETRRGQLNSIRNQLLETTPAAPHIAALNALEQMSVQCVIAALRQLGLPLQTGDRVPASTLATQLCVASQHHRLLGRLMDMLVEEGVVKAESNGWTVLQSPAHCSIVSLSQQMQAQHSGAMVELTLLTRCALQLADVLRGVADPLPLLFPSDGSVSAADIYRNSAGGKLLNSIAAAAVQLEAAELAPGCGLRVLEIGAGTGSTAASILPLLPADRSRYVFTDIAPGFLSPAKERFSEYGFVDYRTLNIENDPAGQGFAPGSFDIIIAANVLHATADMQTTMRNIRKLLNRGGRIVVIEGTRPVRWLDLTFGLTPGWWRFEDTSLRPSYPLLNARNWRSLLYANGFETPAFIDPLNETSREPENSVVISRLRDGQHQPVDQPQRRWAIATTSTAQAPQLQKALQPGTTDCIALNNAATLPGRMTEICQKNAPTDILIHIGQDFGTASGQPSEVNQNSADASPVANVQKLNAAVISALQAVQQYDAARSNTANRLGPLRLWLATTGAVAAGETLTTGALPQASVWGLWRSIALEHPQWECSGIDLDPAVTDAEAIQLLAAELLAAPGEIEPAASVRPEPAVAFRRGVRLVRRLSEAHPQPADNGVARVLTTAERGTLAGLQLTAAQRRMPIAGEIEVAVQASGLNFRDVLSTLGLYPTEEPLGAECTGIVTQTGPGVTQFSVGDRVAVLAANSICDFLTVNVNCATHIPHELPLEDAATIPVTFLTAAVAFAQAGGIRRGQRVLVHSAAGGVGMAAVQIAKDAGAEVFATASQSKHQLVRNLGVQHVFDSRSNTFASGVLEATGGAGVDLVLNSLDGAFAADNVRTLAGNGSYLDIAKTSAEVIQAALNNRSGIRYHQIDLSQAIAAEPAALSAQLAAIFAKVVQQDYTPLPYQTFDLDRAADAMRLMRSGKHTGKILITADADTAATTCPQPAATGVTFRHDATYLTTGGLGGLGLLTAKWMAHRGARHIALVSRSQPDPLQLQAIDEIEARGAKVRLLQADVSDRHSLATALDTIRAEGPPLAGVFLMAGVLDDGLLATQSSQKLATVLAPKVAGAWNLHQLTRQDQLDYFVMFSSAASLFGSPGQLNHAAANAFLDALAHARRAAGLCGASVNWGPWAQVGAAAGLNVGKRSDLGGVEMLSPAEGMAIFREALSRSNTATQLAGVRLELNSLPARIKSNPLFALLLAASEQRAEAIHRDGFLSELAAVPPKERLPRMTSLLQSVVAGCLGVADPDTIPVDEALFDLGLDSLTALELANTLESGLGLKVTTTDLFNYPALSVLAPRFIELLDLSETTGSGYQAEEPDTKFDLPDLTASAPATQSDYSAHSQPAMAASTAPAANEQAAPAEVHQLLLELNELSDEFDNWEVNE